VPQLTTAGRLLSELGRDTVELRDAVATAAGITNDAAQAAASGSVRLSLSEQLRLAEAAVAMAPAHARLAMRLRGQALAARSYESGAAVECHQYAPVDRWERNAQLRRS
jgi:hypothetical protein